MKRLTLAAAAALFAAVTTAATLEIQGCDAFAFGSNSVTCIKSGGITLPPPPPPVVTPPPTGTAGTLKWMAGGYRLIPASSPATYQFTVPATAKPGWAGRLIAVYITGDQYPRRMVLSATKGGPALAPWADVQGISATIQFAVGQWPPNPSYARLEPGRTYYVSIMNVNFPPGAATSMAVDLYPPN